MPVRARVARGGTAFRLTVNARNLRVKAPPMKRLLDVLRDECGLTGTKEGCATGDRVGLIHRRFARDYIDQGRLVAPTCDEVLPEEALFMLTPQIAERQKPEVSLFYRWIMDATNRTAAA